MKGFIQSDANDAVNLVSTEQSSNERLFGTLPKKTLSPRYSNINKLIKLAENQSLRNEVLQHPIELTTLEMLEAELANQELTSLDLAQLKRSIEHFDRTKATRVNGNVSSTRAESCSSLAQRASIEATLWRWRARRLGLNARKLNFYVDVRKYLIKWAHELSVAIQKDNQKNQKDESLFLHRPGFSALHEEDKLSISKKLNYLDELAAFLNGDRKPSETHPYQRGMSALIKMLSLPDKLNTNSEDSIEPVYKTMPDGECSDNVIRLSLPLSREEFFNSVKKHSNV